MITTNKVERAAAADDDEKNNIKCSLEALLSLAESQKLVGVMESVLNTLYALVKLEKLKWDCEIVNEWRRKVLEDLKTYSLCSIRHHYYYLCCSSPQTHHLSLRIFGTKNRRKLIATNELVYFGNIFCTFRQFPFLNNNSIMSGSNQRQATRQIYDY